MRNITSNQLTVFAFMMLMAMIRIVLPSQESLSTLATFTSIGAMALFGGAYFKGFQKYFFPLFTLWVSDVMLNRFLYFGEWVFFYEGSLWTYGAFALMVIVGNYLGKKVSILNFLGSALLITFIHWIVTDLGVFLGTGMYPMTWSGWWMCLTAAIPFEQNFFTGTLLYGSVMFSVYQWMISRNPSLITR